MDNKYHGKRDEFTPVRKEVSRTVVSYGYEPVDPIHATWYEVPFYKKDTPLLNLSVVKTAVEEDIDARTREKIASGLVWEGKPVWLSLEQQQNIKSAHDLAVQTGGDNLPLKMKLGEDADGRTVYHTFRSVSSLKDLYVSVVNHVQQCREAGWAMKDGIDWSDYESAVTESATV